MKKFTIDFDNKGIYIYGQGLQYCDVEKKDLRKLFPTEIFEDAEAQNITWDFTKEKLYVNERLVLEPEVIPGEKSYKPVKEVDLAGLGEKYEEFLDIVGISRINVKELLQQEMPELRKLL